MSYRRTDFRLLQVKRDAALRLPETVGRQPKPKGLDQALIEAAIAAGRLTKYPSRKGRK